MALEQVTKDMWATEGDVSPGPGMRMATRMTVVRKPSGGLVIHSPIELSDEVAAEIDALGTVEELVAPNLFHHLYLSGAVARWPEATLYGPPGMKDKRGDLEAVQALEPTASWLDCFEVFAVDGMPKFREYVFLHQPTKTLIVTDLVFNEPHGSTLSTRLFFRVFGTYGKLAVSRLFRSMIRDKAAFSASIAKLMGVELERVVMAHGKVLELDAQARFRQVIGAHRPSSNA